MSYDSKKEANLNLIEQQEHELETDTVDENINLSTLNTRFNSQLKSVKVYSTKLNLDFTVYVQDETGLSQQRCTIMTIHDIGCDHTEFHEFITCPEMRALRERIIWIHVDLPGQEANAEDLKLSKYPTLVEIAEELVIILDHFKLSQVVLLGVGAGANIAARFGMKYPSRCFGTILVHPTGSTATFMETFKDKLKSWNPIKQHGELNTNHEAYLIYHRFGASGGDMQLVQANIKEFQQKLYATRNSKNLSLFIESFLNRTNITEKINDLKVDVLVAVGKKASLCSETKKFYKALYDSRKNEFQRLVNCPLLEVEDVGDIMGETPDRLAVSLRYFLQGIGLLPAIPMKQTLQGLGRLSRAFSMEDADRPRRISLTETMSPKA